MLRWFFVVLLFLTLAALVPMIRHYQKWFGHDKEVPWDSDAGHSYNAAHVFGMWFFILILCLIMISVS